MYSILPETLINRGKRYRKIHLCIKEGCLEGKKKSLSYEIPKEIITDRNWTQANFENVSVVMKKDFVEHSLFSNKIPPYASQFPREWLVVRGINKMCERFHDKLEENRLICYDILDFDELKIFSSPKSKNLVYLFKRFLKSLKIGRLQDINDFELKEVDIFYIELLENDLDYLMDSFCDLDSGLFNKEKYVYDDSGFREFYEIFVEFKGKLKVEDIRHYFTSSESDCEFYVSTETDSDY